MDILVKSKRLRKKEKSIERWIGEESTGKICDICNNHIYLMVANTEEMIPSSYLACYRGHMYPFTEIDTLPTGELKDTAYKQLVNQTKQMVKDYNNEVA